MLKQRQEDWNNFTLTRLEHLYNLQIIMLRCKMLHCTKTQRFFSVYVVITDSLTCF